MAQYYMTSAQWTLLDALLYLDAQPHQHGDQAYIAFARGATHSWLAGRVQHTFHALADCEVLVAAGLLEQIGEQRYRITNSARHVASSLFGPFVHAQRPYTTLRPLGFSRSGALGPMPPRSE